MALPRLKIGMDIDTEMPVYIQDRYIHILLMGKSGSGKSTSITNWWEQDNYYGHAKILVDPSGFLAGDCYSISRGIYCSIDHDISINPMISPYTDSQISDLIAEAINQVVAITTPNQSFTVKMRGILDTSIKWCLKNNRKSLLHVLDHVKTGKEDKETRDGIISRLSFLLNDERMLKLLCGNNSIEWGELIAKHQTFIMDGFGMGKEKLVFTGSLIANGVKNYFRYARPKYYLPLSLFIDEAQNFINPSMFDILAEGRKYKISCVLATQSFATIEDRMTRALLNVGNIMSYRLGHREAGYVAHEIGCTVQDLQFIEKFYLAYLTPEGKGIAKAPRPPFIKEVKPPKKVEPQRKPIKPSWFTLESYQTAQTTI